MTLAASFVLGYIDFGNIMLLIFSMLITIVLLLGNILTMIEDDTKVKFKDNKTSHLSIAVLSNRVYYRMI